MRAGWPATAKRYPLDGRLLAALDRGRRAPAGGRPLPLAVGRRLLVALAGWRLARGGPDRLRRPRGARGGRLVGRAADRRRRSTARSPPAGAPPQRPAGNDVARCSTTYVGAWRAMYIQTCEATHVRGEQSAEVLDLRMSCLSDNLDQVHALVDTIAAPEGRAAAFQAVTAAKNLTPVSRCADVAVLRSDLPLPKDEQTLQAVVRLRRTLLEVRALREVGSIHAAFAKAQALRRDVEAAGYRPLLGKTLTALGMVQTDLGVPAEQTLEDAVFAGESVRDDLTVATASAALVFIVGYRLDRLDDAKRWARLSAAALDRLVKSHESERVRSWLLHNHAVALYSHRNLEPALALIQQAIALKEETVGKDHPDTALSLWSLGSFLTYMGRSDEALPVFQRAIGDRAAPRGSRNALARRGPE